MTDTTERQLHPTGPFDFAAVLQATLDSGATNSLDQIDVEAKTLQRPQRIGESVFWLRLAVETADTLTLTLRAVDDGPAPTEADLQAAAEWANQRFYLDVDLTAVEVALRGDAYGDELADRFIPTRPANYPGAWEALLKSVVHMQIYETFARQLDEFLRVNYGTRVTVDDEPYYLVPTPEELLAAAPDDLRAAKFSRQKADFLTTIPRQIIDDPDTYDFDAMRRRDPETVVAALKTLHGVGDWVAQNVAMRGLPHPDVFIDEKTTRSALTPYYGRDGKLGKKDVKAATERFSPYRSFACYYTYMKHFG